MFPRPTGLGHLTLLVLALLFRLTSSAGDIPIRDGGINPQNLGKGDWIYFLRDATNRLGGSVPSVVNLPTLMSYYKSVGMQHIIVKAGTGSTNFTGGLPGTNQFTSNLVHHAHAAGLLIFAYTRSYADDVQGEINMAASCFALGADGWVIDAEAEWESSRVGSTGPAKATQYGQGLRARFPNKFIAHAPFPIISFHSSLPYKEFGLFCDVVMPQCYWTEIYGDSPTAVSQMFTRMDNEYRSWQNSLSGIYTNAIKPIVPIAQAWNSSSGTTTGAEIDEFFDRLRTNPNPASITGYKGMNFWRADLKTTDMWSAISTNILGDTPGAPNLTMQPQSRNVALGTNVSFTAWGTGSKPFYYRWRFNNAEIPGATSPSLVLTNIQFGHAGGYSVVVSNVSGVVISAVATLNVIEPETLFNITAIAGATQAIISWTSTNASSSRVEFGATPNLGESTLEDTTPVFSHSMLIAGLTPNSTYHFTVLSRSGANIHRSSGWSFSTAGELILDNHQAGYTGSWTLGTTASDKFGSDYRFAGTTASGNTASALFAPDISIEGNYDVYIWYPQGGNRSTNTPVQIFFNGGTVTTRVNQEIDGGSWRMVGTNLNFRSETNGFVRISNSTGESNQVVMADAVRFVYRSDQDTPSGPTAPDWWMTHYFGSRVNTQLDQDADGIATWAEYLIGTAPNSASSRLEFWSGPSTASPLTIHYRPHLPGRSYQLEEKAGENPWTTSNAPMTHTSNNGIGSFSVTNSFGPVKLYRLKVGWSP